MNYRRRARDLGVSFQKYLQIIGFIDPSINIDGMDDGMQFTVGAGGGLEQIDIPRIPVTGSLELKVLLVDFADNPGSRPAHEFEEMLFSKGIFPTGSLYDFYQEVSLSSVAVTGSVHGWLRLPQSYAYYTHGESGMGNADLHTTSYPNNAQRMAEDAVKVALQQGITFSPSLDKFGNGTITALFIVHAGPGAETIHGDASKSHIWSHKWNIPHAVNVGNGLFATTYLTVPENCRMGVCAHELGHLAFQWEDFYDPNYDKDGHYWDGSGVWDLMAGGSWNGSGNRPAHPAGLHKSQHGWVNLEKITKTTAGVTIPPYSATAGKVVRIQSSRFVKEQFLILENRRRDGFDNNLPGEGLLVWRVDLRRDQTGSEHPAMMLVQADGRNDLDDPTDYNQGDTGDPFPGSSDRTSLGDTGEISTSFPADPASGIQLRNIRRDPQTGVISLDIEIA